MSDKTTTCARANQLNRRLGAHQIDLFSNPAVRGGIDAPLWRDLPRETQDALVNLMMQLMLEHAQRQSSAAVTMEASHDH
jgi:hypothetical protein